MKPNLVETEQAMPLVFAWLLDDEADLRARQLDLVGARYDAGTRDRVQTLASLRAGLHPMQRLPLASLVFPALRRRPRGRLTTFMIALRERIDVAARVTLEEYCLARLIGLQVMDALDPAASQGAGAGSCPTSS